MNDGSKCPFRRINWLASGRCGGHRGLQGEGLAGPGISIDVDVAQGAGTEVSAHHLPTRLGHQLQEPGAGAAGAGHDHLGPWIGFGRRGHQQGVVGLAHHAQAINGTQIAAAHPQGITVAIDVAVADAGEIEAAQQRIHLGGGGTGGGEAGAPVADLLVDVELGPLPLPIGAATSTKRSWITSRASNMAPWETATGLVFATAGEGSLAASGALTAVTVLAGAACR